MCKRLLTALLAAALLYSTALAAPIAANFLDSAALIDEDGAVIVAPGAYDFIFAPRRRGRTVLAAAAMKAALTATRCLTARANR